MGIKDEIARIVAGGAKQLLLPAPKVAKEGIKAYHATPHWFDRFDTSHAFSGEGAQMYGPGIYLSSSPKISGERGHYWNQFNEKLVKQGMPINKADITDSLLPDLRSLDLTNPDLDSEIKSILGYYGFPSNFYSKDAYDNLKKLIVEPLPSPEKLNKSVDDILGLYNKEAAKNAGKEPYTYETLIYANKEDLIDQDKPLGNQDPIWKKIKEFGLESVDDKLDEEKLTNAFLNETDLPPEQAMALIDSFMKEYSTPTNWGYSPQNAADIVKANLHYNSKGFEDIFNEIDSLKNLASRSDMQSFRFQPYDKGKTVIDELVDISKTDPDLDLKALMKDLDIPGTRYLAGGSRSGHNKNPDYNYTIWDEDKLNIMKRYAIPGAVGAGALGAQSDPSSAGESWSPDEIPAKVDKLLKSYVEPRGELSSYTPTAQENVSNWIAENTTLPIDKANDYTWLAEWLPPVAAVMEGYNAQKYRDEGDMGNAALSALFSGLNAPTSAKAKALLNGAK